MNHFDDDYEATRADYNREAYGAPCPKHGTLTWQADCPDCEEEIADLLDLPEPTQAPGAPTTPAVEWSDDDIPF